MKFTVSLTIVQKFYAKISVDRSSVSQFKSREDDPTTQVDNFQALIILIIVLCLYFASMKFEG